MFVSLQPPVAVTEHLTEFLAPRQEAVPELRWTRPEHWHVTLAFLPAVADPDLDALEERLATAAARRTPTRLCLAGAGALPDPDHAKVVVAWVAADPAAELRRLAAGVRAAAAAADVVAAGGRFRPHLTLARSGRPQRSGRWLQVLDGYRGPPWEAVEIALVESHLGEGPRRSPRHETRALFAVGETVT